MEVREAHKATIESAVEQSAAAASGGVVLGVATWEVVVLEGAPAEEVVLGAAPMEEEMAGAAALASVSPAVPKPEAESAADGTVEVYWEEDHKAVAA